jgi:hypothetical protein
MKSRNNRAGRWAVVAALTFTLVVTLPFGVAEIFDGVSSDVSADSSSVLKYSPGVNAYATVTTVRVTFDANKGLVRGKAVASKKIKKGTAIGNPPVAHRTGYKLKGWFTKKSGGKKASNSTKAKTDTILYAQWSRTPEGNLQGNLANGGHLAQYKNRIYVTDLWNDILYSMKPDGSDRKKIGGYIGAKNMNIVNGRIYFYQTVAERKNWFPAMPQILSLTAVGYTIQ